MPQNLQIINQFQYYLVFFNFLKNLFIITTKYLIKNNILSNNQFGFRCKHDASMEVIEMVNKISIAIDNSEYSAGVFIDLSKAFDTLDHHKVK